MCTPVLSSMSVTVVIPAFNEEANIARITEQILGEPWQKPLALKDVLIVDDCSSDNTQTMTEQLAREHACVRVIRHAERSGKNAGIRTGMAACRSDVIVVVDADLRVGPECITKMVTLLTGDPSIAMSSCIIEPLPARSWKEQAARVQALLVAEFGRSGIGYLSKVYAIRMSAVKELELPDTTADDAYIMGWLSHCGYRFAVCRDAIAYMRASTGLRDFAKQTLRGRRGEIAAKQQWQNTVIVPVPLLTLARAVLHTLARDPVGFMLYAVWYGIIKATPAKLWLPVMDVSRYDTSASTKDLGLG